MQTRFIFSSSHIYAIITRSNRIDTLDDAIHSNKNIQIKNGEFLLSSSDVGLHADEEITIDRRKKDLYTILFRRSADILGHPT